MLNSNSEGIYFNPQNRKIMAVNPGATAPIAPWTKFAADERLGLLDARRELERLGLTDNAQGVEWYGTSASNPEQRSRVSNHIRAFRDDSERSWREAESKQEFWHRLVSLFKSPLPSRGDEA
jgi:hypothetical protein